MSDSTTAATESRTSDHPLVFISHDSRDAELAEAFSGLLKSASAGMLKSFRSSDKKGSEGIEFGDEWYKRLMDKLSTSSHVVCLLTDQSLGRPWILYEAGVAKGKLNIPVHGVALGIDLNKANVGPFFQFQNCGDDKDSLVKLVVQLCKRVPGLDPDVSIVDSLVDGFRATVDKCCKDASSEKTGMAGNTAEDGAVAKLLEEVKISIRDIPHMIKIRVDDGGSRYRNKFLDRYGVHRIEDMVFSGRKIAKDPAVILMVYGLFRDDFPWIYEVALELYRAVRSGNGEAVSCALASLREVVRFSVKSPIVRDMGPRYEDTLMWLEKFTFEMDNLVTMQNRSNTNLIGKACSPDEF